MYARCSATAALTWLANVVVGLACTGLRIAEFASLRWCDFDLANERLQLTDETARSIGANRKRRELKSGQSRTFPIHPDFLAVLRRLPRADEFVFHGPRGGRLKPDTVRRVLVREVIEPLSKQFPTPEGEKGFAAGRLAFVPPRFLLDLRQRRRAGADGDGLARPQGQRDDSRLLPSA